MKPTVTAERARDSFGLCGYIITLPDGRKVFLTKTQVELLKEEIEEYDKEAKKKKNA